MAFIEVGGRAIDIKKFPGQVYTGKYTGKREKEHGFDKTKKDYAYSFITPEGQPFEVWGFSNLNRKMGPVPIGTVCRLTYVGIEKIKYKQGEKPTHIVKLEIDDKTEIPF